MLTLLTVHRHCGIQDAPVNQQSNPHPARTMNWPNLGHAALVLARAPSQMDRSGNVGGWLKRSWLPGPFGMWKLTPGAAFRTDFLVCFGVAKNFWEHISEKNVPGPRVVQWKNCILKVNILSMIYCGFLQKFVATFFSLEFSLVRDIFFTRVFTSARHFFH